MTTETKTRLYGLSQIQLKTGRAVAPIIINVLPKIGYPTQAQAKWYRRGLRFGFTTRYVSPSGVQAGTWKYRKEFAVGLEEGQRWIRKYQAAKAEAKLASKVVSKEGVRHGDGSTNFDVVIREPQLTSANAAQLTVLACATEAKADALIDAILENAMDTRRGEDTERSY